MEESHERRGAATQGGPGDANAGGALSEVDAAIERAERDAEKPHYLDTLLPDGAVVRAQLVSVAAGMVANRLKWLALFRIADDEDRVDAEMRGRPLLRAWNAPPAGRLSPQHSLHLDWMAITEGRVRPLPMPPETPTEARRRKRKESYLEAEGRRARQVLGMIVAGCELEVRTHIVKRRMDRRGRQWVETPPSSWYSAGDAIVCVTAGTARVEQRRRRLS